ncbi:unnamed protein product, partial [Discosporangium mesarthrocarpum]
MTSVYRRRQQRPTAPQTPPVRTHHIFPGRSPAKAGRRAGTYRISRPAMSLPSVPEALRVSAKIERGGSRRPHTKKRGRRSAPSCTPLRAAPPDWLSLVGVA